MNPRPHHLFLATLLGLLVGGVGVFYIARHVPVEASVAGVSEAARVSQATPFATSTTSTRSTFTIPTTLVSTDVLDGSFAHVETWQVDPATRMLLVPHHLVAARYIASLIAATPRPSVVYLISPDHYTGGKTTMTTTDASFSSVAGSVDGSSVAVERLLRAVPVMRQNDAAFPQEHGITGIVPFIAKAWPAVPVVPIMLRPDARQGDLGALSTQLAQELRDDPRALVISSIDFSHYLSAPVADFHDELAQDVIKSLSDEEASRVEDNSSSTLNVLLKTARLLGLGSVTMHAETNSARILQAPDFAQTTSHIYASFAPGPIQAESSLTLLFTGDMMFDRNVATRSKAAGSLAYPFDKLHGDENRFFEGQDLVIPNLEGPVTPTRRDPVKSIDFAFDPAIIPVLKKIGIDAVSQSNNHSLDQGRLGAQESRKYLEAGGIIPFGDETREDASSSVAVIERRGQKVVLVGFTSMESPLDKSLAAQTIAYAKTQAPHVIVFMHWGQEYQAKPNAYQVELGHWFIDQGVETVIGSHPHWMESVERYHGHLIAYSLGNCIFDQDFSSETTFGLIVGLTLAPTGDELHLFPISIKASQPEVLVGDLRNQRLEHLADISDPALRTQIENGVLYTQ